jgi:hypothetical protein
MQISIDLEKIKIEVHLNALLITNSCTSGIRNTMFFAYTPPLTLAWNSIKLGTEERFAPALQT